MRKAIILLLLPLLLPVYSRAQNLDGAGWIGAPWFDEKGGDTSLPAPEFRKEFHVRGKVREARISISGLGYFVLSLNGKRVGDDLYTPAFTDYGPRPSLSKSKIPISGTVRGHRVLYVTYNLKKELKKGKNAIGVLLGNGFYNTDASDPKTCPYGSPRLICRLEITYRDGRKETVVSDSTWYVRESALLKNGIYGGDVYDARKDNGPWERAVPRKAPGGLLEEVNYPPDKVVERISPIYVEKRKDGLWTVDFGRTVTGRISVEGMKGKPGDSLEVRYVSETLQKPDLYIFKGRGKESYAPEFHWNVFTGCIIRSPGRPSVMAEEIHSDVKPNAAFSSSEPMLERIERAYRRTQLHNMHSGFSSDCPHREKLPYTGDGQVAVAAALGNFDAEDFYRKWITDIRLSQDTLSGYIPNGAPYEPYCGGGPAWGAAIAIMPWEFYLRYGDLRILRENLPAMKDYLRYLLSWQREDGAICSERGRPGDSKPYKWYNLGDWCAPGDNPDPALVHTFYTWYVADIASRSARLLGTPDPYLEEKAGELSRSFHGVFYNPATGSYGPSGSNVFALVMGVPEDHLEKVREALRAECADGHLHSGIYATRFLPEVLSENGMGELAFRIMTATDFPSIGHWFSQGADTLWEQWDGMNSHDHPMFGGCLTWFYRVLAGVRTDPTAPGYRRFTVRPIPVPELREVRYETDSRFGKIVSEVSHDGSTVSLRVTVPDGCSAVIYHPVSVEAASLRPYDPASWTVHSVGPGVHEF